MLAAVATRLSPDDPLSALELLDVPEPQPLPGWAVVEVRAASLNHHDLWSLRGVGLSADRLPIVLGCDATGVDEDGNEVIVHPVLGDPDQGGGDETLDPTRHLLSERIGGSFAQFLQVPRRNLVPKPSWLTFEEAACLPVCWTTAYRMLFTQAGLRAGDRVLVQGAGGGVAGAAITLASAAGAVVYATSRTPQKQELARRLGAREAFAPGSRLPERVDIVIETVGRDTWDHSLRSLRPGGTVVVSGATTGPNPPADLARVFYHQLRVLGSTGGTRAELVGLLRLLEQQRIRPHIDRLLPLKDIRTGLQAMLDGNLSGKVVIQP